MTELDQVQAPYLNPDAALNRVFNDKEWRLKISVGATINACSLILLCINPILIPLSVCGYALNLGYQLKVMRSALSPSGDQLPNWGDWMELVISGLTLLAIFCGWSFAFALLTFFLLCLCSTLQAVHVGMDPFVLWSIVALTFCLMIGLAANFLFAYLSVNLAEQERTSAGLAIRLVMKKFAQKPGPFIRAWLLALGLHLLAFIVPIITVIGVFLLPMSLFWAGTVSAILLAQSFASADPCTMKPTTATT